VTPADAALALPRIAALRRRWRWMTWVPLLFVAVIVVCAIFPDAIAPYNPNVGRLEEFLLPPSAAHWFGTDALGRDVLSRTIAGSRVSIVVGVLSVALALSIGVPLGIASALSSGWIGDAIMRATDLFLAMPSVLIALAIAATVGSSLTNVILLVGFIYWAPFARMVRGEALSIRERDFIQSAYAIGCGQARMLYVHMLPNLANPIIVLASLQIAAAILLESTLSFLGVGVPPPTPTWGTMVSDGRPYVQLAWWAVTVPGIAIMAAVLCINVLGDELRDRLDPKFRHRR
jgi:peptide/nickel transport system permease protein